MFSVQVNRYRNRNKMQLLLVLMIILGVVTTPLSTLELNADTGKMTGRGVYRNNGRFAGWIDANVEVFWDIDFAKTGILNISFSVGNLNSESGAVFEIKLGDNHHNETIRGTTTASGGYLSPKMMTMGTINVTRNGKQRLTVKAVTITGSVAGDVYIVSLTGPASANATVVDVFRLQAHSTHLLYKDSDNGRMYYNDVIVTRSFLSTYISAIAFENGYFGIQEYKKSGKEAGKLAIFSLWDNVNVEQVIASPDELASVVELGTNVKHQKFGGEGTGMKTTWQFDWHIGEKVEFLLTVKAAPNGYVHYTAFLYLPTLNNWKLIAVLKRKNAYHYLKEYYSFLEDWEGGWGHVAREASFNPWVRTADGKWEQPKTAVFTSSNIPTINESNLNAWEEDGRFYMRTGGNTTNTVKFNNSQVTRTPDHVLPSSLANIDHLMFCFSNRNTVIIM